MAIERPALKDDSPAPATRGAARTSRERLGLGLVALAVLWQGTGTAVVGQAVPQDLATFATFVAFLVVALASVAALLVVRRRSVGAGRLRPRARWRDVVVANAFTAAAFGAFYVAVTLVPPTAASVLEVGTAPIVVALVAAAAVRRPAGRGYPGIVLAVCAGIAWISISAQVGQTPGETVLGIALCVVAGGGVAGVLVTSHRFARQGFTALELAASRFHLAWVVSGFLAIPALAGGVTLDRLGPTALIATTCIALPILPLQAGIMLCKPLDAALVLAVLPAVVLGAESVLGGGLDPLLGGAMAVLVGVCVAGALRRR
ncbi:hypothetical protein [Antribacter gilvus]|uniref:hypothetical protein n=1 Tax=Antribacter gilvus TaxID=2304675 RepID=UPI000F784BC9|nr:hypothetical protein [Antribacter gilvus]